jgi:hypothetical protein
MNNIPPSYLSLKLVPFGFDVQGVLDIRTLGYGYATSAAAGPGPAAVAAGPAAAAAQAGSQS